MDTNPIAVTADNDPLLMGDIPVITVHPLDEIESSAKNLPQLISVIADGTPTALAAGIKPKFRNFTIMAYLIQNPYTSIAEVAKFFSVSPGTVKAVVESDMFVAALAEAQQTLLTEGMFDAQVELQAGMKVAAEQVNLHLTNKNDPEFALRALDKFGKALGLGHKPMMNVTNNTQINIGNAILAAKDRYNAARNQRQIPPAVE